MFSHHHELARRHRKPCIELGELDGCVAGTGANWTIIVRGKRGSATGIANLQEDTDLMLGGDLVTGANVISVSTGGGISMAADSDGVAMNGAPIDDATVGSYAEKVTDIGTVSNTVALSATGAVHRYSLLGGNASPTLPGSVPDGTVQAITWEVGQSVGQAYTITWPNSTIIHWIGVEPPAPVAGTRSQYLFTRRDGDALWIGRRVWSGVPL